MQASFEIGVENLHYGSPETDDIRQDDKIQPFQAFEAHSSKLSRTLPDKGDILLSGSKINISAQVPVLNRRPWSEVALGNGKMQEDIDQQLFPPDIPLDKLTILGVPQPIKQPDIKEGGVLGLFSGAPESIKPLQEGVSAYNIAVTQLTESLSWLKQLQDLMIPQPKVKMIIERVQSGLEQINAARKRILKEQESITTQHIKFSDKNAQLAITLLGNRVTNDVPYFTQLQQFINAIQTQESGMRGHWRQEIQRLQHDVAERLPAADAEKLLPEHFIWLCQLAQAAEKGRIPDALWQLAQHGIALPDMDLTLSMLSHLYPTMLDEGGKNSDGTASLSSEQDFLQRQAQLAVRKADELYYAQILYDISKKVVNILPDTLNVEKEKYHLPLLEQAQVGVMLQKYYALALANQPLSPKEVETTQKYINSLSPGKERDAIISMLTIRQTVHQLSGRAWVSLLAGKGVEQSGDHPVTEKDLTGDTLLQYQQVQKLRTIRQCAMTCWKARHALDKEKNESGVSLAILLKQKPNIGLVVETYLNNTLQNDADPVKTEHCLTFLLERARLLQGYMNSLASLLAIVPQGEIAASLSDTHKKVVAEHTLLEHLLTLAQALVPLREHLLAQIQATEDYRLLGHKLDTHIKSIQARFDQDMANNNQALYQYYCTDLKTIIEQTCHRAKEQQTLKQNPPIRKQDLTVAYQYLLQDKQSGYQTIDDVINDRQGVVANDLGVYRAWQDAQQETRSALEQLNLTFQKHILVLQQEVIRAHTKGNGGYPEDQQWMPWLESKVLGRFSPDYRLTPQEILLSWQLALHGLDSMYDAYAKLASLLLHDNDDILQSLGITPSQLQAWAVAYPDQMRELAGNIDHAYRIITANSTSLSTDFVHLVQTAWGRGTTESIINDLLLGERQEIVGVTHADPMPPAMIALLNFAGWVPFLVGAGKAVAEQSIAGKIGNMIAKYIPIPGFKTVCEVLLGSLQTKLEKDFSLEVTQHRNVEVAVNAVLEGLNASGGIQERVQKGMRYVMQRQLMQEIGTFARDTFEVGKVGAWKRFTAEMALWWDKATLGNKAVIVTVAALPAVLTVGAYFIWPWLLVPGVLLSITNLLIMRSTLNMLSPLLGLSKVRESVRNEVNTSRIKQALEKIQQQTDALLKQQEIKPDSKVGPTMQTVLANKDTLCHQVNNQVSNELEEVMRARLNEASGNGRVLTDNTITKLLHESSNQYVTRQMNIQLNSKMQSDHHKIINTCLEHTNPSIEDLKKNVGKETGPLLNDTLQQFDLKIIKLFS